MVALAVQSDLAVPEDRLGLSVLTRYAFSGRDINEVASKLLVASTRANTSLGAAMDLAIVEQIKNNPEVGLALQRNALSKHNYYRTVSSRGGKLKLLVLAAPIHMGGNTPIELLLDHADVEICTVYVAPGLPIPDNLPEHDLIFIAAPGDTGSIVSIVPGLQPRDYLAEIENTISAFRLPVVNRPERIFHLERDQLPQVLDGLKGVRVPQTIRCDLDQIAVNLVEGDGIRSGSLSVDFPLTIRPVGSHAGFGFEMIRTARGLRKYLNQYTFPEYFISELIDYSSVDEQFRKFRIIFVDGKPYPCHMAISEQWKLWYMNAGMDQTEWKRAEEAEFMLDFDQGFGRRFRRRLAAIAERVQLDYFGIDCAIDRQGNLVIFEADNAMIVHDMDPDDLYPYKRPAITKLFRAFEQLLYDRANMTKETSHIPSGSQWKRIK